MEVSVDVSGHHHRSYAQEKKIREEGFIETPFGTQEWCSLRELLMGCDSRAAVALLRTRSVKACSYCASLMIVLELSEESIGRSCCDDSKWQVSWELEMVSNECSGALECSLFRAVPG